LLLFAVFTHGPSTSAFSFFLFSETDGFQSIKKKKKERNRHFLGSIFLICFQSDFYSEVYFMCILCFICDLSRFNLTLKDYFMFKWVFSDLSC
jgi:hypothetical protein